MKKVVEVCVSAKETHPLFDNPMLKELYQKQERCKQPHTSFQSWSLWKRHVYETQLKNNDLLPVLAYIQSLEKMLEENDIKLEILKQ